MNEMMSFMSGTSLESMITYFLTVVPIGLAMLAGLWHYDHKTVGTEVSEDA